MGRWLGREMTSWIGTGFAVDKDTAENESGASVDIKKYNLIYFSRSPKQFNMKAKINITTANTNIEIHPKTEVRILGVYLNLALRWKLHLHAVEAKAVNQL